MLLTLVSAQRSSDLVRLSLPVSKTSNGVSIPLHGLAKQSEPGKSRGMEPLSYASLCPVKCLTSMWHVIRHGGSSNHNSSWPLQLHTGLLPCHLLQDGLKDILQMSGIDISCFSAHSTRGASTSAAALSGVTTASIMQRSGSSQRSTFTAFYHKPIVGESIATQFSNAY